MKNKIIAGLVFFVFSFFVSCKEEVCRNCRRCISYDSNNIIKNEVVKCNSDTTYLNNYEQGFISGADSANREAICFDLGIQCECE
jgi:hypothetical protein